MKVIIVGGGIAGMTLANALERANIDFVLLEARGSIDPQVGASIGINPGGLRIFDQVGAADEIMDQTCPIGNVSHHNKDGSFIMPPDHNFALLNARFGYQTSFLDRQLVLKALLHSAQQPSNILVNKRVADVEHSEKSVVVNCTDGSFYEGDVLVGCDGVDSKIRAEMWRIAGENDPTFFLKSEKSKMSAEYTCFFGISKAIEGLPEGTIDYTYDKDHSSLAITGKDGRMYWFLFDKLDRVHYRYGDGYPRYTKADAEKLAAEKLEWKWHEKLTFAALWERRITYALVPMEEALFDHWSWGRIAVVGDGSHKMTANHGQAGNNAIESAAVLANQLQALHTKGNLSANAISSALTAWQKKRQARVDATYKQAADICRMQALKGLKERIMVYLVMPNAADLLVGNFTDSIIGAELLEYLPVPERSFTGTCAFNPQAGVGYKEAKWKRFAIGSILIALPYVVNQASLAYGTSGIDGTPSHSIAIAADVNSILAIWLIESTRRANSVTPAAFPLLFFLLAHYFSFNNVAPYYYILHYTFASLETFAPADMRLTNLAYTRTVLPLLLFFAYAPSLISTMTDNPQIQESLESVAKIAPLLIPLLQWMAVKIGLSKVTIAQDCVNNTSRDMKHIRLCISILTLISTATWWSSGSCQQFLLLLAGKATPGSVLLHQPWQLLTATTSLWLLLLISDLKQAAMTETPWPSILVSGVVLFFAAGPAGMVGPGWLWREEILVSAKEKHAMTRERFGGGETFRDVEGGKKAKA